VPGAHVHGGVAVIAAIGWVGALGVLLAYGLNHRGRMLPHDASYLALNTIGSVGLLISCASAGAWPSAVVNVIWLLIGIPSIVTAVRARRHTPVPRPAAEVTAAEHHAR
jgi:hypothetical protein